MKHYLNVCDVNGATVEPVDVITFGSPCQDLSVAGKRAGLKHESNGDGETTRSGLFMEAVRIIKEMRKADENRQLRSGRSDEPIRPRFAVWENVPGAFSSNKGEDFRIVLEELARIKDTEVSIPMPDKRKWQPAGEIIGDGWSIAWRTLDAQYHGVPQRRRRIFLVADFADQCAGEILFECKGLPGYPSESSEKGQGTAGNSTESTGRTGERNGLVPYTLKIRSGCEGGGKGALIQTDKSATLAVAQDQTLFQPVCYCVGAYNSEGMKSDNPKAGFYETDTSRTLDLNGGNPACNQGGICICEPVSMESGVIDVETEVYVRKYEVDCNLLCECLRDHKSVSGFSNKEIAEQLNLPLTKVEHWFRQDSSFAIPDAEIWMELKKLLGIETDEFDESITTYVAEEGKYDMSNRIYVGEVAPTLTTQSTEYKYLLPLSIENHPNDSRVQIREDGTVQSLTSRMGTGGGNVPLVAEPTYCIKDEGFMDYSVEVAPTLKQRDYKMPPAVAYLASGKETVGTLMATAGTKLWLGNQEAFSGDYHIIEEYASAVRYIVRRLIPTECARLQGMPDAWCILSQIDDMSDEDYEFWKQAHFEKWKLDKLDNSMDEDEIEFRISKYKHKTKAQMIKWYNGLQSDAPEYKAYGNGMALPCVRVPIHGIAQHGAKTMASLFDGIGGFPLAGLMDGIQTLWTSEIELFPIAVTMERFREYEKYGCFTFGMKPEEKEKEICGN